MKRPSAHFLLVACVAYLSCWSACTSNPPRSTSAETSSHLACSAVAKVAVDENATTFREARRMGTEHADASLDPSPATDASISSTADANIRSLTCHATTSGTLVDVPLQRAEAEASFSDTLTITGAEGGGAGSIIYSYVLEGTASGAGQGAFLFVRHGNDAAEELGEDITVSGEFQTAPHAFTFGVPFEIGAVLRCQAQLFHGATGHAWCRFTATLASVQVRSADGKPVRAVIHSASGRSYTDPITGR